MGRSWLTRSTRAAHRLNVPATWKSALPARLGASTRPNADSLAYPCRLSWMKRGNYAEQNGMFCRVMAASSKARVRVHHSTYRFGHRPQDVDSGNEQELGCRLPLKRHEAGNDRKDGMMKRPFSRLLGSARQVSAQER